jgi:hypothetical protein
METALDLIVHQTDVFARRETCGGMLAVIGPPSLYDRWPQIASNCARAGSMDDSHFVVAGAADELERLQLFLKDEAIDFMRLPVRYPFHTDRIETFRTDLTRYPDWPHAAPAIPTISCCSCDFVRQYSKEHMWRSIREPMDTGGALDLLERTGQWTCVDLSPGSAFAAALRRRKSGRPDRIFGVLTPFGNELANFNRVCDALDACEVRQ